MSCNSETRERERSHKADIYTAGDQPSSHHLFLSLYISFLSKYVIMMTKLVCTAATNVSCGSSVRFENEPYCPTGYTYRVPLEQSTPYLSPTTTHTHPPALNGPAAAASCSTNPTYVPRLNFLLASTVESSAGCESR